MLKTKEDENDQKNAPNHLPKEFNLSYPASSSNPASGTPMSPATRQKLQSSTSENSRFSWLRPLWLRNWLRVELNFYRCHLLTFIFIPCIFAIIFYVAHGSHSQELDFLDCLFMCYSAMTMTGLNTILLASLNRFQQALLYILMSVGSTTTVSIVMIYVRLGAFKERFQTITNSTNPLIISRPILPSGTSIQLDSGDTNLNDGRSHAAIPNLTQPVSMFQALESQSNVSFEPSNSRDPRNRSTAASNRTKQLAANSFHPVPQLESPSQFARTDSPVYFEFPKLTNETSRRPPLVRRNSDGGVVGARSSFTHVEHPSTDPPDSSKLLSILKSPQETPGTILSNNISFKQSTRKNTQFNQTQKFFPRSVTLDQSPSFQQNYPTRSRAASLARDRNLTFALQRNLINPEPVVLNTNRITPHRFPEDETHLPPLNPFLRNPRGSNPLLPGQLGWVPGMEPDITSPKPDVQTPHHWRTRRSLSTVAPDHAQEGLRRRNKPPRTGSVVSNSPQQGRRSASIATRASKYHQSEHSISGQSNAPSKRQVPSSFTRTASIEGFGGFPNPFILLFKKTARKLFGGWLKERKHSLEFVRTSSLAAPNLDQKEKHKLAEWLFGFRADVIAETIRNVKTVSYIKFNAIVGRNSNFLTLTSAQEEELGGLEYRALSILFKILIGYWIMFQFLALVILIPYLETPIGDRRFPEVFDGPGGTDRVWYAIWITCSSFTNGGMSLIDAGFTVFRDAHILMLTCSILIIAGNTGYPIMLRGVIWTLSKTCSESTPEERRKVGGGRKDVLNFLLDHPRRCFIYLFPSRQTWYLLLILLALTFIDWICFLLLDIGNPKIELMPLHTRILVGLLQSLSVRAAGFSTVPLGDLAPAVQVLFLIMMYIAVYPIAISIRSTNVYEERSMGIFDPQELHQQKNLEVVDHEEEVSPQRRSDDPPVELPNNDSVSSDSSVKENDGLRRSSSRGIRNRIFGKKISNNQHHHHLGEKNDDLHPDANGDAINSTSSYFAFHIRQQLAFDIWWLALAVWCICIVERNKIVTAETPNSSFSIFSIIFEVVSAYGTIGLSMGLTDSATSMVGGFSPFSKLIVIVVMLRGRHRGLPIAIDRAVLFPYEKSQPVHKSQEEQEQELAQEPEEINKDKEKDAEELRFRQLEEAQGPLEEIQGFPDALFVGLRRPVDIESQL